jgi:hypothetical protein
VFGALDIRRTQVVTETMLYATAGHTFADGLKVHKVNMYTAVIEALRPSHSRLDCESLYMIANAFEHIKVNLPPLSNARC